jgi:ribosomal protein S27E
MATSAVQRKYRAPCPGCGAPVDFFSAQATHAVCGFCKSTVVRTGDVLARIGKMAELLDDHSPLQLMATGTFDGQDFTVVGRLQYQYGSQANNTFEIQGSWTEWSCLLASGETAFLSEDNGAYVFGKSLPVELPKVPASHYRLRSPQSLANKLCTVTSNRWVSLRSAEGELPHLPAIGTPFEMVEMRSPDGEVFSLDYSPTLAGKPPSASAGRSVALADLALKGLKDESVKNTTGRQFACPNCGGTVKVMLDASKSVTCGQCRALIDLSQGIGAQLKSAIQDEPISPSIPVGSAGLLRGTQWQVVGYQHRTGRSEDDPDESFGWEEYLLYNQKIGFQFLVDSEEGWSLVKPATGAPSGMAGARTVKYLGKSYTLKYSYTATTEYVVGEFYWQVKRGQRTKNCDYASGADLLSSEQDGAEITWSYGGQLSSDAVASAFGLVDSPAFSGKHDAALTGAGFPNLSIRTWIYIVTAIVLVFWLLSRCSSCDPRYENCSRSSGTSGGSFGGYSSGGGHK